MATPTAACRRDIRAFCERLPGRGIRPERLILFGSQAVGRARSDSDIDLVVVSRDFRRMGLRRRLELLGMTAGDALVPVQALGYTPEEVEAPEATSFLAIALSGPTVELRLVRRKASPRPSVRSGRRAA